MSKYIDLASVIDVCPTVESVLDLILDEDIVDEVSNRMNKGFAKDLVEYLNDEDYKILKEAIENDTRIH